MGKWIATMLEYDLKIKPTKLIKGKGMARLMTQTNCELLGINFTSYLSKVTEEERATPPISQKFLDSAWYVDIIFVLKNLQDPPEFSKTKARFLKFKVAKFV